MIQVIYSEGAQDFGAQLFGGFVSDEELAAATGALSGATLSIRIWKQTELRVEIQHEYIEEYSLMFGVTCEARYISGMTGLRRGAMPPNARCWNVICCKLRTPHN